MVLLTEMMISVCYTNNANITHLEKVYEAAVWKNVVAWVNLLPLDSSQILRRQKNFKKTTHNFFAEDYKNDFCSPQKQR